jgi:transposase
MSRNLFWLSDEQWARIEPHLSTDVRGVERADDRRVISGIVHVLKSGCRWCDCPEAYGPPTTVYNRFVRWARRGIWENLFRQLAANGRSADTQMIDSTHVKAHRSAAGGKGGSRNRLLAARAEGATRRSTHSQILKDAHRHSVDRRSSARLPGRRTPDPQGKVGEAYAWRQGLRQHRIARGTG